MLYTLLLSSKGMRAILHKKYEKCAKYIKTWEKMYKIWNYFEKQQPHDRMKQLEYTLIHHWRTVRNRYKKSTWVGFEPKTTEFRTDGLTD